MLVSQEPLLLQWAFVERPLPFYRLVGDLGAIVDGDRGQFLTGSHRVERPGATVLNLPAITYRP